MFICQGVPPGWQSLNRWLVPTQRDETNPDKTIVPPQNLSAFSEYSKTVLRALDEQTECQP